MSFPLARPGGLVVGSGPARSSPRAAQTIYLCRGPPATRARDWWMWWMELFELLHAARSVREDSQVVSTAQDTRADGPSIRSQEIVLSHGYACKIAMPPVVWLAATWGECRRPGSHPLCRKRAAACRRQISDSISQLRLRDAVQCTNLKRNKRAERVSQDSPCRPAHLGGWLAWQSPNCPRQTR
jgi:hypothetical protein